MIFISHRGNISGPNPENENQLSYIEKALNLNYFVEIDLWHIDHSLFLGHDFPQHSVDFDFINNEKFFIHCKNSNALLFLLERNNLKSEFFWHQHDDYILTSKNNIWVEPGKKVLANSICCLPEKNDGRYDLSICYGICSDYVDIYKESFSSV